MNFTKKPVCLIKTNINSKVYYKMLLNKLKVLVRSVLLQLAANKHKMAVKHECCHFISNTNKTIFKLFIIMNHKI